MSGLGSDRRLLAWPGTIVERRHCTIGQRPLNAALDRLMMHPQRLTHRKERGVFPVSQQHSRSLDPARRLRSRACYRNKPRQILFSDRQLNRSSPCRHDLRISSRQSKEQPTARQRPNESLTKDRFHGIDELGLADKNCAANPKQSATNTSTPRWTKTPADDGGSRPRPSSRARTSNLEPWAMIPSRGNPLMQQLRILPLFA